MSQFAKTAITSYTILRTEAVGQQRRPSADLEKKWAMSIYNRVYDIYVYMHAYM